MELSLPQHTFLLDTLEFTAAVFQGAFEQTCPGVVLLGAPVLADSPEAPRFELDAPLAAVARLVPAEENMPAFCRALARDHKRLFATKGSAAPPYESCHTLEGTGCALGPQVRAMRERLAAFGLESGASPDHLCVELGYLYLLFHMVWVEKKAQRIEGTAFAAYMLPWCERFALAVHAADKGGYFDRTARMLVVLLRALSTL